MLGLALVLAQQPGGPEPPRAAPPPPPAPPPSAPARHALRGAAEEGLQAKGGLRPGRQGVPADVRERGRLRSHPEEQAEGVEEVVQARGLCRGRRRLRLRGLHGRRPGCRGLRGLLGLRGGRRHRRPNPDRARAAQEEEEVVSIPQSPGRPPAAPHGHVLRRPTEEGVQQEAGLHQREGTWVPANVRERGQLRSHPQEEEEVVQERRLCSEVAYEYDYDYGDYDYSLKKTKFCTYPLV